VAFTLANRGPGNEPEHIGHGLHGLIPDQVRRYDADRLRDIPEVSRGAKGRIQPVREVSIVRLGGDDER